MTEHCDQSVESCTAGRDTLGVMFPGTSLSPLELVPCISGIFSELFVI